MVIGTSRDVAAQFRVAEDLAVARQLEERQREEEQERQAKLGSIVSSLASGFSLMSFSLSLNEVHHFPISLLFSAAEAEAATQEERRGEMERVRDLLMHELQLSVPSLFFVCSAACTRGSRSISARCTTDEQQQPQQQTLLTCCWFACLCCRTALFGCSWLSAFLPSRMQAISDCKVALSAPSSFSLCLWMMFSFALILMLFVVVLLLNRLPSFVFLLVVWFMQSWESSSGHSSAPPARHAHARERLSSHHSESDTQPASHHSCPTSRNRTSWRSIIFLIIVCFIFLRFHDEHRPFCSVSTTTTTSSSCSCPQHRIRNGNGRENECDTHCCQCSLVSAHCSCLAWNCIVCLISVFVIVMLSSFWLACVFVSGLLLAIWVCLISHHLTLLLHWCLPLCFLSLGCSRAIRHCSLFVVFLLRSACSLNRSQNTGVIFPVCSPCVLLAFVLVLLD